MGTRLSVVIPGYNNPCVRWVCCVQSVLDNLGPDDEIICVDDGSAPEYNLLNLANQHPSVFDNAKVRIIKMPANAGQAAARNKGVAESRGRFVTFVDSDDVVFNDIYNKSIAAMHEYDADVAVFGVNVIWSNEGLQKHDVTPFCYFGALRSNQLADIYQANLFNYAWNKVYRKDFLMENGIVFDVDGMPFEDVMYCLDIVEHKARWVSVGVEGYCYMHRSNGSQVSTYSQRVHKGAVDCAHKWSAYISQNPLIAERLKGLVLSERQIFEVDWRNIWLAGSPMSMVQRWRWLVAHANDMAVKDKVLFFLKKALVCFLRRFVYIRPIRRWNLKRLHKNIEEWHK